MKIIDTKEIFKVAWELYKKHWSFLYGILAVLIVLNIISAVVESYMTDTEGNYTVSFWTVMAVTLVSMFVGIIIQTGIIQTMLGIVRGTRVQFSQIVGDVQYLVPFFLGSLLYGLVVTVGFILLIVPGVIWSLKYSQMMYLIVDKRMKVMDAFKKSGEITDGSKGDLFIFGLAVFVVVILSAIPLGLGLLITIPMSIVFPAIVYTKLMNRKEQPVAQGEVHGEAQSTHEQTPAPESPSVPEPFVPLSETK